MPDSQVEEIKSKLNIVDVVADYLQLKKVGTNFKARCPFHEEKTASFYVSPVRQIWHCFGCGLGGDAFEFVKQIEGVDFPQALERLAQKAGVVLTRRSFQPHTPAEPDRDSVLYEINDLAAKYYYKILTDSTAAKEAREYLTRRKFSPATWEQWRLGYAPDSWDTLYQFLKKRGYREADMVASGLVIKKDEDGSANTEPVLDRYFDRFRDRITFPILNAGGKTVGFSARILHPRDDAGKYINSPESPVYSKSQVLFGYYQARMDIRRANAAIVVEGNADCVKSWQAGIRNVVASSGTALTEQQVAQLKRLCDRLIFAFDADAAGLVAARRALDVAVRAGFSVRLVNLAAGLKDPDEIIDRDPELWRRMVEEAPDYLDFYFHGIFDILDVSDAQAKKQATADFLSLLAQVSDPIVIAHYVQQVARRVGVKEILIADILNKLRSEARGSPAPVSAHAAGKTRASAPEILEQRLTGLLLKYPHFSERIGLQMSPEHFTALTYRDLFFDFLQFYKARSEFDYAEFLVEHPRHRQYADVAVFAAETFYPDPEIAASELAVLSRRLLTGYLLRQRDQVSLQIAAVESLGRHEDMQQLIQNFNSLSQQIAELEQISLTPHGQEKKVE